MTKNEFHVYTTTDLPKLREVLQHTEDRLKQLLTDARSRLRDMGGEVERIGLREMKADENAHGDESVRAISRVMSIIQNGYNNLPLQSLTETAHEVDRLRQIIRSVELTGKGTA